MLAICNQMATNFSFQEELSTRKDTEINNTFTLNATTSIGSWLLE